MFTLNVLWYWTLNSAKNKIEATTVKHLTGFRAGCLHLCFLWLTTESAFTRTTKMLPTASWRAWIKNKFDSHIVWSLAGLFFLPLPPNKRGWHSSYSPICWFLSFPPCSFKDHRQKLLQWGPSCQACKHSGWLFRALMPILIRKLKKITKLKSWASPS